MKFLVLMMLTFQLSLQAQSNRKLAQNAYKVLEAVKNDEYQFQDLEHQANMLLDKEVIYNEKMTGAFVAVTALGAAITLSDYTKASQARKYNKIIDGLKAQIPKIDKFPNRLPRVGPPKVGPKPPMVGTNPPKTPHIPGVDYPKTPKVDIPPPQAQPMKTKLPSTQVIRRYTSAPVWTAIATYGYFVQAIKLSKTHQAKSFLNHSLNFNNLDSKELIIAKLRANPEISKVLLEYNDLKCLIAL